jgi:hypothetical protein
MVSRIFQILLVVSLTTGPVWARTDPMIGTWKLIKATDQMKVTKVATNRYAFDFGGGPETIVVDGKQQPGIAGTTLSVAADGASWRVIRKKDKHMLLTATWTLSKDGNSLHDNFTSFSQTGSPSNVKNVYQRRAAGSGFAGTWVSMMAAVSSPIIIQVRTYDRNGLSIMLPSQTISVNFDGKDYPAGAGTALSARRPDARTLEIVRKVKGKIAQARQIDLSPNLKTLTMTVHLAGKTLPLVYVFERQ